MCKYSHATYMCGCVGEYSVVGGDQCAKARKRDKYCKVTQRGRDAAQQGRHWSFCCRKSCCAVAVVAELKKVRCAKDSYDHAVEILDIAIASETGLFGNKYDEALLNHRGCHVLRHGCGTSPPIDGGFARAREESMASAGATASHETIKDPKKAGAKKASKFELGEETEEDSDEEAVEESDEGWKEAMMRHRKKL